MTTLSKEEEREVRRAVLRLNAQAWGIAFALLLGLSLFLATIVLVLKGGPNVGAHLRLLSVYFPGYRVTTAGAFVGAGYGLVVGYLLGRVVGTVYNRVAFPGR